MHLLGYIFCISVIVEASSTAIKAPVRVYAEDGASAVLTCPQLSNASSISWQGPPNYMQYTDGEIVNSNLVNKHRLQLSRDDELGEFVLEIHNVTADDEGFYRCTLVINGTVCEYDIHLLLEIHPSNISIENAINNKIGAVEGVLMNLSCTFISGNMRENVSWLINGTIVEDDKYTLIRVDDGYSKTVTILYKFKPAITDQGNVFTCMVKTEMIQLTDTVQLNVLCMPKVKIRTNPSTEIIEGTTLSLVCEIDANPDTNIVNWYKDGRELKASSDTYIVTSIDRDQAGVYECKGFNDIGSGEANLTISVLFPPVVNATFDYIGQSVKFICLAEGVPQKYRFAKWEHKSFFGSHIRFLSVNPSGEYLLPNVNYQDNGVYVCKAENGIHSHIDGQLYQQGRTTLKVKGPPVFVTDNKQVQYGSYGKVGIISIYVYSFQMPSSLCCSTKQWKICQNTHPYYFQVDYAVVRDRFYEANFLLHGYNIKFTTAILQSSDFKPYTFVVSNSVGTSQYVVDLKINDHADRTSDIKKTDKDQSDKTSYIKITDKDVKIKLSLVTFILIVGAFLVLLVSSHVCSWYLRTKRGRMHVETSNINADYSTLNRNSQYEEIDISLNTEHRSEHRSNLNSTCQTQSHQNRNTNNVQSEVPSSSSVNSSNSGYDVISPEDIAEYLTPYSSLPNDVKGEKGKRTSQTFLKRTKSV